MAVRVPVRVINRGKLRMPVEQGEVWVDMRNTRALLSVFRVFLAMQIAYSMLRLLLSHYLGCCRLECEIRLH